MAQVSHRPDARSFRRVLTAICLVASLGLIGLLPVLPALIKGSPVLNNDMLVAYFCYFWDFHRNWSWSQPLVFWSSSYQCGMPMHGYWQSGYLYPVTWLLFGPLSPHIGIHLFYAFHFALGIYGFMRLGPRMGLHRTASLWAGLCFALSGTMLARYEHATFLAGWAWIPLVLSAFLALRDSPGPKTFFIYAGCVALQALGGHPQASVTTAILIGIFTVTALLPGPRKAGRPGGGDGKAIRAKPSRGKAAAWILGGHVLALVYCAPLLIPFLQLVDQTDRFDGVAWDGGKPGETASASQASAAARAGAAEKLEEGVFAFEKFATGGMRPIHLASLFAPHALGSPSNASWWGGEAWGEVFVYLGGLGLFFCLFASPRRAGVDMRWVLIVGLAGLWLSFGAHLGASQILYQIPVLNNFRRPARFLILFALAMAVLSGHGLQRWLGRPFSSTGGVLDGTRGRNAAGGFALAALALAAGLGSLRYLPELRHSLLAQFLAAAQHIKDLDPAKDYGQKLAALLGRGAADSLFLGFSAAAVWFHARLHARRHAQCNAREVTLKLHLPRSRTPRYGIALLFLVLSADLLRLHWDHFYLFPSDYYRKPPATVRVLDQATSPFWRVSHYLEYPGLELWQMHNDPMANFDLLEREKTALSCGIHAVFGYRHVTAHLPLMWRWDDSLSPAGKSARYLFSNLDLAGHRGDSVTLLGRFGAVNAYELNDWRPRLEAIRTRSAAVLTATAPATSETSPDTIGCREGYSGYGGICVREPRDGEFLVEGSFGPGDTLIIRERFSSEWRYRVDGGEWLIPVRTADSFTALPLEGGGHSVEMVYTPTEFYQATAFCLILTAGLLGFFRFRYRKIR